ncbi:MAG TPA: chemotaxis response regulator protein-glutamate methylesterase [Thermodesulfovibrionales bacterium]|nr:chemotaxis response regulator protein-glutamate methylesterase [Thermodesulfovibrionales bacterium]
MSDRIKVLIVDDSPYSRQTIKGMLEKDQGIEVAGIASDGIEAMAKTMRLKPDVITLDFEMPEMDGFSFLRWLMKERPTPVVMVSSHSDSSMVFKALELGAVDFIAKPSRRASVELLTIQDDLLGKIKGIRDLEIEKLSISRELLHHSSGEAQGDQLYKGPDESSEELSVVAIGASTGGPTALQIVLTRLPLNLPAGIVVSQHMPKGFTKPFTERLAKLTRIKVKEAADGDIVEAGKALVCPGGHNMIFRRKHQTVRVMLREATGRDKYVPSVDLMMSSAAEHFGPMTVGVVLTGMGNDGRAGVVEIKKKGGYTIAEAESTAVIFGMPNEAIKAGAVDRVLPLHKIPGDIIMTIAGKRDRKWKRTQS